MMTIISLPFYDDGNASTELLDERVVDKQKKLFEIATKSPKIFMSLYSFQDALSVMCLSGNGVSMDILLFISKLCIANNDYFDINLFNKIVPYLFLHVKNVKLWLSILRLLTKIEGNEIEDFLLVKIVRQGILPHFIDLLTALIPFEIQNHSQEDLSFRILHLLYSMVMSQNISLFGVIKSIQNLCSVGYGERPVSRYPFQLSKKIVPQARRPSRSRAIKSNVDNSNDHITQPYTVKKLVDLDPTLYDDTFNFMSSLGQVKMEQFAEIDIPQPTDPEDFTPIFETPIPDLISLLAAKTLAEIGNDTSNFKKSLTSLTIFGADVLPAVAIEMHKKIVLILLDDYSRLSNDSIYYLMEFLTYRIIEGWWKDKIADLLTKMIRAVPGYHRALPNFIIACLSSTQSTEQLMQMGTAIMKFQYFIALEQNSPDSFIPSFLFLCVTKEIIESSDSKPFLTLLNEKIEDQSYHNAFCSNKLPEWIQESTYSTCYRDLYQEITQAASTNSSAISQERSDITRKSVNSRITIFMKTSIVQATFLRRSFRFQFFTRINESSYRIERAINTLFKVKSIINYSKSVPSTFCRVAGPHPLVVPFKLVPKLFDYDASYTQSKANIAVPVINV